MVLEHIDPKLLAVAAGSPLMLKLLGPSVAYLGDELKGATEARLNNLKHIFVSAYQKLGSKADEPGKVPPRVLKGILEDGPYCDDEVTAEYLAGVLASSRSEAGVDDRGVVFIEMLSRMSAFQIRAHYIFYTILKELCDGTNKNIAVQTEASEVTVFIPQPSFDGAMALSSDPDEAIIDVRTHILLGLNRESLIEYPTAGPPDLITKTFPGVTESGMTFEPTGTGVELYLWGQGSGDVAVADFLQNGLSFGRFEGVDIPPGSRYRTQPDPASE